MKTKTETRSIRAARSSRRLGIGAGFLPLLSTERSKAVAQTTGYPLRFIGITLTGGVCPPNFFPTGAAGPLPATLPATLQPLAHVGVEDDRPALRQQAAEPDRPQGHGRHRLDLRRPLVVSRAADRRRHRQRDARRSAAAPSIDQLFANHLATQGVSNALLNVGARPFKSYTSYRSAGTPNTQVTDPYKLFNTLFAGTNMPVTQVNALLARRQERPRLRRQGS